MKYAGLIKNDVVNGHDVCVSYWCQGCPHRCEGCHNPETWNFEDGIEADEDTLTDEILEAISKNGVARNFSILGGEPLCDQNLPFTRHIIDTVKTKYPSIKIYLWTGYTFEELFSEGKITYIQDKVDVLIDGKYEMDERDVTLSLRGSYNQRIIYLK